MFPKKGKRGKNEKKGGNFRFGRAFEKLMAKEGKRTSNGKGAGKGTF